MGNRHFLFLLLVTITIFSDHSFALSSCENVDAGELTQLLDYAGTKFSSSGATCVQASTDSEATTECKRLYGANSRVINPGNPEYKHALSGIMDETNGKKNTATQNTFGFYLCYKGTANDKEQKCKDLTRNPGQSDYNKPPLLKSPDDYVNFSWMPDRKECGCYFPKSKDQRVTACSISKPPTPSDVASNNKECAGAGKILDPDSGECKCNVKEHYSDNGNGTCKLDVAATTTAPPTDELKDCVENQITVLKTCISTSKDTKKTCEQYKEDNSAVSGISSVGSSILGIVQQKGVVDAKAGIDSRSQCALASLASSGLASLLSGFQKSCDEIIKKCNDACKPEKDLTVKCKEKAKLESNGRGAIIKDDKDYLARKQSDLDKELDPAVAYCDTGAKKENSLLAQGLNSALMSQSAAQSCACANSTDGGATCGPTTAQCLADPSLAGCPNNGAINCQLGSNDYTSDNCECLRDATSAKCHTALQATVSQMGAPLTAGTTSGSANFGTAPGSTGGDFPMGPMNLSMQHDPVSGDETRAAKLSSGGDSLGAAAGVGGGGGGSGGGGNGAAAGAPEEDKTGLSGAFSMLKSALGMGSGSGSGKSGNGSVKAKDGVSFDPDKFSNKKGLRGVAGGTGLGTRNMDLFKMIEVRRQDQDKQGWFFDPSFNPK